MDLSNCYIPDPAGKSGAYARRGFDIANKNFPLPGRGQGGGTHIDGSGVLYNLIIQSGKLYRTNAGLTVFTDITPTSGVTISATVTRVYLLTFVDQLIISDGVNPPWIATDLDASTATGTYIDFDGSGTPWSAFGQPVEYAGSLFFALNEVDGVKCRLDIAWSAPGDAATGYQQPDYDFRWTLIQTGSTPIYALCGTNIGLYYFRDASIGLAAGVPGPDFQSTHTDDAIADNVGCLQSATIAQWGRFIYFCDAQGRAYMMPLGGAPVPIWLNMRTVVDESTSNYPTATAAVSCAVINPTSNLYHAAIWSPVPGATSPPVEFYTFDAKTGTYLGRWSIAGGATIEAMFVLNNAAGNGNLVILGNEPPSNAESAVLGTEGDDYLGTEGGDYLGLTDTTSGRTGCVWAQNALIGDGIPLTTEDGFRLTTEDGAVLTTENTVVSWMDDGQVPNIYAITQRLGYSEDVVWNVDQCSFITGSAAPCLVTMQTPTTAGTVEGTPAPSPSEDGTYRLVVGANVQGRGTQVKIQPVTADDQWSIQRIGIVAIPSLAGPDDA